ncbi:hypothetical protein [uncultured Lutibacter sp.]|uniref:hypothetical protein n=1 Tax=uncultured Lutibacter sp. TaxID=437739 RepID=UPI00261E2569|nr:hypothetical protein [uncultured Lutibacter sp.]
MKTLLLLFTVASLAFGKNTQETITMTASFDGFEDGYYYFTDEDDINFYFESIDEEVIEKYNLKDSSYIGKSFEVTYKMELKMDDNNEEYESFTIIKLTIIEE